MAELNTDMAKAKVLVEVVAENCISFTLSIPWILFTHSTSTDVITLISDQAHKMGRISKCEWGCRWQSLNLQVIFVGTSLQRGHLNSESV